MHKEMLSVIISTNTDQSTNLFPLENKLLNKLLKKLLVKVKSLNFANRVQKYFLLDKNFDGVTVLLIIPDVREKQLVIRIN